MRIVSFLEMDREKLNNIYILFGDVINKHYICSENPILRTIEEFLYYCLELLTMNHIFQLIIKKLNVNKEYIEVGGVIFLETGYDYYGNQISISHNFYIYMSKRVDDCHFVEIIHGWDGMNLFPIGHTIK